MPAVGIGVTMTLPMDIRLASTTAKFGFVFARRGIVPEACSSWFLPRLVGISQAAEWCYTGRVFGADEALAGGLVRSVHEPDDLLPAAHEIAREIAENDLGGVGGPHPGDAVAHARARRTRWRPTRSTRRASPTSARAPTPARAWSSFLEKRPAHFTDTVSADMPPHYPWWTEPGFRD